MARALKPWTVILFTLKDVAKVGNGFCVYVVRSSSCIYFFLPPTGVSLKKKQMWTLEPAEKDLIAFKSHLDKYLSVDQVGFHLFLLFNGFLKTMWVVCNHVEFLFI